MKVAIAGGQLFCDIGGIAYFSSLNLKYLSQWTSLFDKIRLFGMRAEVEEIPPGWLPVPKEYDIREMAVLGLNQYARRKMILSRAKEHLKGIDLLYARGPNFVSYYTFCIAEKAGIPLLYEMHGDWETSVLSERSCNFFRVITKRLRAKLLKNAQSKMAKEAIAVMSIGPALAEKYVTNDKPVLISTNHHIEEKQFVCRQNYALNSPPRILFVGVLKDYKGLKFLFSALKLLKEEGRSFEMIIVGTGPLKIPLTDYARQHNFLDNVKFAGQVSSSEVMNYLKEADLFILPSIGGEGVPRVIQEAFSCGCPVLATDVGSVAWQLENGSGIVVKPGSEIVLAEKIKHLFDDESLRKSIGEAGFNRGLMYTFEKQAERIVNFVNKHIPDRLS
ncbi:MAG: hypothetical protein DRP66_00175 [Planctomycetota bacterium]|nr:MAG: hypothetical protein DRP66_00175 [Planctomycetota bacterium]